MKYEYQTFKDWKKSKFVTDFDFSFIQIQEPAIEDNILQTFLVCKIDHGEGFSILVKVLILRDISVTHYSDRLYNCGNSPPDWLQRGVLNFLIVKWNHTTKNR